MSGEAIGLIKAALEHLRPSLRTIAAAAFVYVGFLLSPAAWGVRSLAAAVLGGWVLLLHGVGALSIATLATYPFSWGWEYFKEHVRRKRSKDYLRSLSPREKTILNRFIGNNRKSVTLDMVDGDVKMLVAQGILFRLAEISRGHTRFDYNIQPWVFEYLRSKTELLAGAEEDDPDEHGWMGL